MYDLKQTPYFSRVFKRFAKRHPELKEATRTALDMLRKDPFAPSLRLHSLTGRLAGKQAGSINYAYRIVLCVEIVGQEVILLNIGSHDEVYG